MSIRPVDPRDVSWEVDRPYYRVYFWRRGTAPPGHPEDRVGAIAEEFELSACVDVNEAIGWATANVGDDRTYTLYALVSRQGEKGLIRLFGVDPTKPGTSDS
jgi:hypothetical protein